MKHIRHISRLAIIWVTWLGVGLLWGGNAELDVAHKYYNCTKFEESLKVLDSIQDKDAAVFQLRGLNHYMRGDYKKAIEDLQTALKFEPKDSMTTLWLARAYGRRAESSSPFTAIGYASHARENFERAEELDPRNLEALSDLFEYYLDAPGFLGGGIDRAEQQVARIAAVDPSEAEWAQAKLAEKQKHNSAAEEHLRQAIKSAPRRIGLRLELARFLARQGRFEESENAFAQADRVAPGSPKVLFARAEVYVKYSRNLEVAKQMLQHYLSLALTPDDPSRADAAKLLRQAEGG